MPPKKDPLKWDDCNAIYSKEKMKQKKFLSSIKFMNNYCAFDWYYDKKIYYIE
jgi:hypothetical protein